MSDRTRRTIRVFLTAVVATIVFSSCRCPKPPPANGHKSTVAVKNDTDGDTIVYVAFGANSVVLPASWSFCAASSNLTCSFKLAAHATQDMPLAGQFLNATMAFGAGVGCGSTKAEMTVNNPAWYDVLDVSLVDGFSNKVSISIDGGTTLGPPVGRDENEKVFGLFPYGCDICVARQAPPCGIPVGKAGCKGGTQYKPDVPCQYQGPTMGGGSKIVVSLVK
jgi:hypothetical protein